MAYNLISAVNENCGQDQKTGMLCYRSGSEDHKEAERRHPSSCLRTSSLYKGSQEQSTKSVRVVSSIMWHKSIPRSMIRKRRFIEVAENGVNNSDTIRSSLYHSLMLSFLSSSHNHALFIQLHALLLCQFRPFGRIDRSSPFTQRPANRIHLRI